MQRSSFFSPKATSEIGNGENTAEVRREFILKAASMLGLAVSAGTLGALATACETTVVKTDPPSTGGTNTGGTNAGGMNNVVISIAQEANLQQVGGAVIRSVQNRTLVIIRSGAQEFLAFSAVCTHEGCIVNLPINGVLDCVCHGSRFDASNGRVLTGPAGMPLQQFPTSFNPMQNTLTITI
jgi:Rieske Fe-S protein